MNKKALLLLLCVITATVMNAKQLTAEQARATAREFVNRNATNRSLAKAKASAATEVLPYGTDAAGRTMVYAVNVGKNAGFVPATQAIAPFSAFFLPIAGEAAPQLAIDFSFRHSTAIGTIDSDRTIDANAPIYNLNGQRVTNPAPGIYITGGKKVIIK